MYPGTLHCNIAAVEANLALGHAPPVADAASAVAVTWAGQTLRILAQNLFHGPTPATRQKRSNEMSTSCQAASRPGISATDEGVAIVVMALLSFADSTPRA
jgi:hypothetical protein